MRHSLWFLVLALLPRLLAAQGVTTAAMQGRVTEVDGSPLMGASILVINQSTGRRWQVTTPSTGRYVLEDVAIGGPYRIDVRAVGFTPESRSGIVLALGQRVVVDFALQPTVLELPPLSVTTSVDPVLSPSRTGPSEIISADRIAALPNLGRDLVRLTLQSPQVSVSPSGRFASEAITIAGQNRGLNSFQVDGGMNFDLYGGKTQPGLQTFPRPISLEAVEELQVLVAPMDVRHGGFVAGQVNTVTKSGTNAVRGSLFGFLSDGGLVGRNSLGDDADAFTIWQYGGTVGGPIVRDRAHFFLSLDLQSRTLPDIGPLITDTAGGADTINIGIRYASAKRFQDILSNDYGLDPGTLGPYHGQVPAGDVLGKITLQLGTNSHLELSHHYTDGERTTFIGRGFGVYFLSSVGNKWPATVHASRAIWTSLLGGRWSNELIASYLHMRDACRPNVAYPLIRVQADRGMVVGGTALICPAGTRQHGLELTENLSVGFGTHVWTIGAHAEALRFEDAHLQGEAGLWNFRNLDSLAVGHAAHYERNLPGPSSDRGIEFRARQIGFYIQDRWQPTRALTLTGGLRLDVPFLPDPVVTNQALLAGLGIDNGYLPSGDLLWSPRLGINYDVGGEGRTFLRGGIGWFSGRPLYQWIANSYRDDGIEQLFLTCDGAEVPPFDPVNQPGTCVSGGGITQRLSFFNPDVRFPQSLKASLGLDQRLPGGLVATVDLLYTRTKDHLYFTDANLLPPVGTAQGEGNRPLYGTLSPTGIPTPARLDPGFGQVVRASNRSGDYSVSVAAQLRKQFGDRAELSGLYGYTRSRDRMSITTFLSRPNLETTPLDGTFDNRRSRPSHFDIPHRVDLNATVRLPYRIRLSLRYAGVSGTAYSYTIRGDANADGIGNGTQLNDIVYVPRDSLDIALATPADWATLNGFIENEPCLRNQRGRILSRNSCRNPWFGTISARVTKGFSTFGGQTLELTADLYNILNLLNREWGQLRVTTPEQSAPMLFLVGYDTAAGRGAYRLQLPGFRQIADLASRWQLELSARYVF
jgi:hypothetical protein